MSNYPFKISCIMAVYNVEKYLKEAIDSIIGQSIGFEKNVQLILVNDGSLDNSGVICNEYEKKYPNNIKVISKENEGVAATKNKGKALAEGEFVTFIDPDDKISKNSMEKVYGFFTRNKSETDLVAVPIFFFEGKKGAHPLNNKFTKKNEIINLEEKPNTVLLSSAATYYRLEIAQKFDFKEDLAVSEDFRYNYEVLKEKPQMGLVNGVKYMYRRRGDGSSLIASRWYNKMTYTPYFRSVHRGLINEYQEKYKGVPEFLQRALMYDLQWVLSEAAIPASVLTKEEEKAYHEEIKFSLKHISDGVIYSQKYLREELKLYALEIKEEKDELIKRYRKYPVSLNIIKKEGEALEIWGTMDIPNTFEGEDQSIYIRINGEEKLKCKITQVTEEVKSLSRPILKTYIFTCKAELKGIEKLEIIHENHSIGSIVRPLKFDKAAPITEEYKRSYAVIGDKMVTARSGNSINFEKKKVASQELKMLIELLSEKNIVGMEGACFRLIYDVIKPFKRKKIWIISDRLNEAKDNGEAFFKFTVKEKPAGVKIYFAIKKESSDYSRMKKTGKVLAYGTIGYKIMHLLADVIISSHADNTVITPFGKRKAFQNILKEKKFVFLQHGIIVNDLSSWLAKQYKDISGLVTTSPKEFKAVTAGNYNYEEENVWLTGMPRYDLLEKRESKTILLMPTWRASLFTTLDRGNARREIKPGFSKSDYFNFYNRLINDASLEKICKEEGYRFIFAPHPMIAPYLDNFQIPEWISVKEGNMEYKDLLSESSLMITDYSSVSTDFAYLEKPVIYCQFDEKEFFESGHIWDRGYFDYKEDGFGKVTQGIDDTIEEVITAVRNSCIMDEKYKKRVEKFFAFKDRNNSKRVLERILDINE